MAMSSTVAASQRRSSCHPSSTQTLACIVVVLMVVQVLVVPISFHGSLQSSTWVHDQSTDEFTLATARLSTTTLLLPRKSTQGTNTSSIQNEIRVKKRRNQGLPTVPDGTFNGYPIYHRRASATNSIHSSVQCVGENFRKNAWIHRSCKFRHFCFDTVENEFVIYQSNEDAQLQQAIGKNNFAFSSSDMDADVGVAIGGINTKWTWSTGVPRLRWFPKVVRGALEDDYYALDDDVVWVPYHSFFAQNPGHLVWDDFLPIFTLLRTLSLYQDDGFQPLLMRYILPGPGMWATCDMNAAKKAVCRRMYSKFLPLFGLTATNFSTNQDFIFKTTHNHSKLVCASQGAAGLGMLTDHGYKLHGWSREDYESMHNHGRGSMLYAFRNFMVANIGLDVKKLPNYEPFTITFAASTSRTSTRRYDFSPQIRAIRDAFGSKVNVQKVDFPSKSLQDQVRIASESAIYVTACGGGAVTAMFLPHGSSVVLYFVEDGGREDNRLTGGPAMLDWDLFNNMAWIRTHWLPARTMNTATDIDILVKLVAHELDIISDQLL